MSATSPGPVPLAEVWRGGRLECVHFGHIAVCDAAGQVVFSRGDPLQPTYLRSSAKPFQAVTALRLGTAERWGLTEEEIALMCASHGAQPVHLQTAESILRKCGLTADDLQCGPHAPTHDPSAEALFRAGGTPGRIHNNCSGKHAGMLATCRTNGWPVETYHRPEHPLQIENNQTMAAFAGHPGEIPTGVDGCGVPSFYLPLSECATAFARLATPGARPAGMEEPSDRVVRAMCRHPILVAQEGQFGAVLIEHLGRYLVAKGGAEGVFCAGLLGRGLGFAIKISDGASRPIAALTIRLLERLLPDVDLAPLRDAALKPVRNTRGEAVGELRVVNV
jgi:L-asparaginase II